MNESTNTQKQVNIDRSSPKEFIPEKHVFFIEQERDSRYYLGSGAVGMVYKAWAEPHNTLQAPPFVAKILNVNNKIDIETFNIEYDIISAIHHNVEGRAAVPPIAKGHIISDQRRALIMPYYDNQHKLSGRYEVLCHAKDHQEVEHLTLRTMRDFAQIMIALRTHGKTCVDRKSSDYYWINKDLIVIDWNVVDDLIPDLMVTEIRLLATIWYELLTATTIPKHLSNVRDDVWQRRDASTIEGGIISIGLRTLMLATYQAAADDFVWDNQPSYRMISQALKKWEAIFEAPHVDIGDIKEFINLLPQKIQYESLAAVIAADLRWRKQPNVTLLADRTAAIAEMNTIKARVEGDDTIIESIQAKDLDGAQNIATQQYNNALQYGNYILAIHKARWQSILATMKTALRARNVRDLIHDTLTHVGTLLSRSPEKDDEQSLNDISQQLENLRNTIERSGDERLQTSLKDIMSLEKETRLRLDGITYRNDSLEGQIEHISDLQTLAQEISYLNQQGKSSFFNIIIPYNQLINGLKNALSKDTAENFEHLQTLQTMYKVLRVTKHLDDPQLQHDLQPYMRYVDYMAKYQQIDLHNLPEVMREGDAIFDDNAAFRETLLEKQVIQTQAKHVEAGLDVLKNILENVSYQDFVKNGYIYRTLSRHYETDLNDNDNARWKEVSHTWHEVGRFYRDWYEIAHQKSINRENIEQLLTHMIDKNLNIDIGDLMAFDDSEERTWTGEQWREYIDKLLRDNDMLSQELQRRLEEQNEKYKQTNNDISTLQSNLRSATTHMQQAKQQYEQFLNMIANDLNTAKTELANTNNDQITTEIDKFKRTPRFDLEDRIVKIEKDLRVIQTDTTSDDQNDQNLHQKLQQLQDDFDTYRLNLLENYLNNIGSDPKFNTPDAYQQALDTLIERMQDCPNEKYDKNLHERWQQTIESLQKNVKAYIDNLPRPKRYQQLKKSFDEQVISAINQAEQK